MKFRKLFSGFAVGVLFFGLCGSVFAADSNIKIVDDSTNRTFNRHVLFFDNYTENNLNEEIFSGSSTTSGGTSTFRNGCVITSDLLNSKEFAILLEPTTAGSCTVKFYGVFGTTTVSTGTDTAGIAELFSYRTAISGTAATSTTKVITEHPDMMAVSVTVTSGTCTVSVGMTSPTAR